MMCDAHKYLVFIFTGALFLTCVVGSCTDPQRDYDEACRLMSERRFDEARGLLKNITVRSLKEGDPRTAEYLCDIGLLAMAGSFNEAFTEFSATRNGDHYVVTVHPNDPLHDPAFNLALWIKAHVYEEKIQQLLALDPESDAFGLALVGLPPTAYALEVLDFPLPEYEAEELRFDGDFSLPRILQGSVATVKLLPAYQKDLRDLETRFRQYLPRLEKSEVLNMAWADLRHTQQDAEKNAGNDQPPSD
jgi:hypothetical protein